MSALERIMGGSPLAVFLRLLVVSLLVGAVMAGLGLDPGRLLYWAREGFVSLFGYGFDVVRNTGHYVLTGAVIVVPIWILSRILSHRSR